MKKMNLRILKVLFLLMIFNFSFTGVKASRTDYYQIITYRLSGTEQERATDNYLKNHFIPALHRAGIEVVGAFKPYNNDTIDGRKIILWIPYRSLKHFGRVREKVASDNKLLSEGSDFLNAPYNKPPYQRMESTLLKAFDDAPHYKTTPFKNNRALRVYELRSYKSPTEALFAKKLKMFNEGGEIRLFEKLGFNALFYGSVLSGNTMPNLMYMTTFETMKIHDEKWDSFRTSKEWKDMSSLDEYRNTVSESVKILLSPTDYSDL